MCDDHSRAFRTRRGFLAATAAAVATGCIGGGNTQVPQAVALDDGKTCEVCSMVNQDHPGPVGQTYYRDNTPEGREEGEPARFCSTLCLFEYYYEKQSLGWEPVVHYVTDYSAVDYEIIQQDGFVGQSQYISAHVGEENFARGEETTLVVDSDVMGAMGPSLIPFTDPDDASSFQDKYGGDVLGFDEVTEGLIDRLWN